MVRILILVCFCSNVFAQQMSDTLETNVINLDEFVITAQTEPTHYKNAIHKIDIISKKSIESRGAVTLEQALSNHSSIRLYNDPILGTSVRMRGISSSNVSILIDGIPVVGRLDGSIDLSQISMQNVERIEIVEGALSNLYGSNAAGGVINIITKKSQAKTWLANLDTQVESIGIQNYSSTIGLYKNKFTAQLNGRFYNYNQFPVDSLRVLEEIILADSSSISRSKFPFNPKKQYGLGGLLRYELDAEGSIILKYNLNQENLVDYGSVKRPKFNPYANDQFFSTTRSDLSINLQKKFDNLFLNLTLSRNDFNRKRDDKRFYLETSAFDSLLQSRDSIRFTDYFNQAIISYTSKKNFILISGINHTAEIGQGDRILNRESGDSTKAGFYEIAPFAELKVNLLKNLLLSLSVRYTYHNIYHEKITPAFHLKYDMNKKLSLRASYAQGYRNPSLKELYLEFIDINHFIKGNISLQPETSHDFQFNIQYEPLKNFDIALNVYQTNIENRISLFEFEALKFQYNNIDRYSVKGVQAALKYSHKGFEFSSSATVGLWSTNLDTLAAPRYNQVFDMNNACTYTSKKTGIGLTINHRHFGNQPSYSLVNDEVQLRTINSYDFIDLSISKSFLKNRLKWNLGIRNLLNLQSTNITGGNSANMHDNLGQNTISQGRSMFLQVSVNL